MAPALWPSHLYLSLQGKDKDSNYFEPLFEITVGAEQTIELIDKPGLSKYGFNNEVNM